MSELEAALDIEGFLSRPIGRYVTGDHYVVWSHSANLAGSAIWGTPDEFETRAIMRLWDFGRALPTPSGGIDVITDGLHLERFDHGAFDLVVDYTRQRAGEFSRRYRRQAIVHPIGMTAAVMVGTFSLGGMSHEWKAFDNSAAAFAWLDRPEGRAVAVEVNTIVEAARGLAPLVREVRARLQERPDLTLAAAARDLGRSVRGLQRELERSGTSFRAEVERARILVAQRLLVDTDLKLEVVAQRVGCSSLPIFSRLFRRVLGETPSQFRRSRR